MTAFHGWKYSVAVWLMAATWVVPGALAPRALGQGVELTEPVYHVANETGAATTPTAPVAMAPAAANPPAAGAPMDFTQRPGEHPLMPLIRVSQASLAHLDTDIRDYSCTFVKRERIDGDLGEQQHILLKVRHVPFSVYMSFIQPYSGREVLFVDGQNENDLLVLEAGWKRKWLGTMQLDPEGIAAMSGQKYPITKVGIRNLLDEIIRTATADTQFAECEVKVTPNTKIAGRSTTLVQIEHPVERKNFRAYISRIFFDDEHHLPIHYDAYLWPKQPGQQPPLDESYTYTNLKINNGFTARDFDQNNPEIFVTN